MSAELLSSETSLLAFSWYPLLVSSYGLPLHVCLNFLLWGHQSYWIKANSNDFILTQLSLKAIEVNVRNQPRTVTYSIKIFAVTVIALSFIFYPVRRELTLICSLKIWGKQCQSRICKGYKGFNLLDILFSLKLLRVI